MVWQEAGGEGRRGDQPAEPRGLRIVLVVINRAHLADHPREARYLTGLDEMHGRGRREADATLQAVNKSVNLSGVQITLPEPGSLSKRRC
jgi:hypothetical protein